jgi:hypothetical protein
VHSISIHHTLPLEKENVMKLGQVLGNIAFSLLVAGVAKTEANSIRATKSTASNPNARFGKVSGAPNATAASFRGNGTSSKPQTLSDSSKSLVDEPPFHADYKASPLCPEATLHFQTDSSPYDTFVLLTDLFTGTVIWSHGGDYSNSFYQLSSGCLDASGCYLFQLIDTAGDGLCCDYGQGYFSLYYNNILKLSGDTVGTFGSGGSLATTYLGDGCWFP